MMHNSAACGLHLMIAVLVLGLRAPHAASQTPVDFRVMRDIEYASIDGQKLLLDLYLPSQIERPPLVVWVHGGAWRAGSKENMPLTDLVAAGYAIASVDYRLSPVARFPAQVHDCKAAIRFLRARQEQYVYDASRIGIAGLRRPMSNGRAWR